MNLRHLTAFLWLQWRIRVNRMRRTGCLGVALASLVVVTFALWIPSALVGSAVVGAMLGDVSPTTLMYLWDGLVTAFLLFWVLGLITELQQSELISLAKLLHLPVSPTGAFLINYVATLFTPGLLAGLPVALGLSVGLVYSHGPAMLCLFPLTAGFVLVITALTYQFRAWLAAMMANPRRRRTVIAGLTMGTIVLCQVPYLLSRSRDREGQRESTPADRVPETPEERAEISARREAESRESRERTAQTIELVNLALPPGWLPLGAKAAAEGRVLPALLGSLAFGLIGAGSLLRSYRTMLSLYTGRNVAPATRDPGVTGRKRPIGAASAARTETLERKIPWLSEPASAVALAGFQSLSRAPESKMLLFSTLLLVAIFGSMTGVRMGKLSVALRPLLACAGSAVVLLGSFRLLANQFGFDRAGFRGYVLSPASRRDILLGKNLAWSPPLFLMAVILAGVVQCLFPMRVDLFLATLPQFAIMYLLVCAMGNFLSIYTPIAVASGSMKPANADFLTGLLQLLMICAFPLVLSPALLPWGIEYLMRDAGFPAPVPVCLLLTLLELPAIAWLYLRVLDFQGRLLQAREQKILEVVAARSE